VERQPVQGRVVDRGAQHLSEGRGAEGGVVVDVAALRTALADEPVGERVELEQVDPDLGCRGQLREHARDEPSRRPHRVDLGGRSQLDHPAILHQSARSLVCMWLRRAFYYAQYWAIPVLPLWLLIGRGITIDGPGWEFVVLLFAAPALSLALIVVMGITMARRSVRRARLVSWLDVGVLTGWYAVVV